MTPAGSQRAGVSLGGRVGEVHVPENGIEKKWFRGTGQQCINVPTDMASAIAPWKDMATVEAIEALHDGREEAIWRLRYTRWHGRPTLPEFEIGVKAIGDPKLIRHPAVGADAQRVIALLL